MLKFLLVLFLIAMTGCAALPENYSSLSIEQLIQGVSSNNKPKIMPANITTKEEPGVFITTANYNVVGGYMSGVVLDPIEEGIRFCRDNHAEILGRENVSNRNFMLCKLKDFSFLAIHYLSKERAGFDTGETYAYFDHIAYFRISEKLTASKIKWISDQYVAFENDTVDMKKVLDYQAVLTQDVGRVLQKYVDEGT